MDFNPHAPNFGKFPMELSQNLQNQLQNLQNLHPGLLGANFLQNLQNPAGLAGLTTNKAPASKPDSAGLKQAEGSEQLARNLVQVGQSSNAQGGEQENSLGGPGLPGQPSKVDLAAMKEKIQKLMKMENLADITLAGYMIKLMRHRTKMSLKDLHDEVSKCYDTLRRSDGSKYTGDLAKALKGCLTSSEIFREVGENVWIIREKEAKMYEEKTTKKLKTLINKKKGRSGRKKEGAAAAAGGNDDADDDSGDDSGDDDGSDGSPEPEKATPVKKTKPAPKSAKTAKKSAVENNTEGGEYQRVVSILENACKSFRENEATKNLIGNPFETISEDESAQDTWQRLGSDKFIGILECFEFFLPVIQEHLKINPNIKPKSNTAKNVKLEAGMPVVKQEYTAAPKTAKGKK